MKIKLLIALAIALIAPLAHAAGELKAIACLYELQAETYRFARLQLQVGMVTNPDLTGKLRKQIKETTQELFLNLHESQPGFNAVGLQSQYQRLSDQVADYVSEAVTAGGSKNMGPLRAKQASLLKLMDESAKLVAQKAPSPNNAGVVLIGSAKMNVERLAHDFEFCDKDCAQVLPGQVVQIEKNIEDMRSSLGKHFSKSSYDLAKNQMVFLRMAVDSRARATSQDLAQSNLIVTCTYLWGLIDEVLDSYTEKSGT